MGEERTGSVTRVPGRDRGHVRTRYRVFCLPSPACEQRGNNLVRVSGRGGGIRFRVSSFGLLLSCSVFRVSGFVFRVSDFGLRDSCFFFRVPCFVFRVSGFRFQAFGFGFRVSCSVFRVSGFGWTVAGALRMPQQEWPLAMNAPETPLGFRVSGFRLGV